MVGSPVPVTAQTFALAMIAGLAGGRVAVSAVVLYIAAAAVGLPVLSGGAGGWPAVTGPSLGYLLGFAGAAGLMPVLLRRVRQRAFASRPAAWLATWLSVEAGSACILGLGATGLIVRGLDPVAAFTTGVWPFLPGDLVKSMLAATLIHGATLISSHGRPTDSQAQPTIVS